MRRLRICVLFAVMVLCVATVLHAKEESVSVTGVVDGDTLVISPRRVWPREGNDTPASLRGESISGVCGATGEAMRYVLNRVGMPTRWGSADELMEPRALEEDCT